MSLQLPIHDVSYSFKKTLKLLSVIGDKLFLFVWLDKFTSMGLCEPQDYRYFPVQLDPD